MYESFVRSFFFDERRLLREHQLGESSNQAFFRCLLALHRFSPSPSGGSFTLRRRRWKERREGTSPEGSVTLLAHLGKSTLPAGKASDVLLVLSPVHTVPVRGQCQRIPGQANLTAVQIQRQDFREVQVYNTEKEGEKEGDLPVVHCDLLALAHILQRCHTSDRSKSGIDTN